MSWNIPSLQSKSLNFSPVLHWIEAADRPGVIVNGDLVKTIDIVQKVSQLILKQASTFSQMSHSLDSIDVTMSSWLRRIPPFHSLDVSAHLRVNWSTSNRHLWCILSQPYWISIKSPVWHCQLHTLTRLYMNSSWSIRESLVHSAFKCN